MKSKTFELEFTSSELGHDPYKFIGSLGINLLLGLKSKSRGYVEFMTDYPHAPGPRYNFKILKGDIEFEDSFILLKPPVQDKIFAKVEELVPNLLIND